jgi:hypothetical protein
MRYEQIITAVTRTLVIRTVREIEAVRLFVRTVDFHLCHLWMSSGMPALASMAYAGSPSWSSYDDDSDGKRYGMAICKRGNLQYQPVLVTASCQVRFARA